MGNIERIKKFFEHSKEEQEYINSIIALVKEGNSPDTRKVKSLLLESTVF